MSSTLPVRPLEGVLKTLTSAVTPALPGRRRRPWGLVVRGDAVDIRLGWVPDAGGGEVLLSCGYALAHLELALRALGYESTVDVPSSGAVGATVRVGGFRCPTLAELALRKAAGWRRPYDRGFGFGPGFESARPVIVSRPKPVPSWNRQRGPLYPYRDRLASGRVRMRVGIVAGPSTEDTGLGVVQIPVADPGALYTATPRLIGVRDGATRPETDPNRHTADRPPTHLMHALSHSGRHRSPNDGPMPYLEKAQPR